MSEDSQKNCQLGGWLVQSFLLFSDSSASFFQTNSSDFYNFLWKEISSGILMIPGSSFWSTWVFCFCWRAFSWQDILIPRFPFFCEYIRILRKWTILSRFIMFSSEEADIYPCNSDYIPSSSLLIFQARL